MAYEQFGKEHLALTKVIENYFGADAWYLDISCLDVARVVLEAGWTKPRQCKDCKYFDTSKTNPYGHHGCVFHTMGVQEHNVLWVEETDFCSAWERKNND